ncbi:MAG: hypothetical protein ACRENE_33475 [Polyangiaceae bacterium]
MPSKDHYIAVAKQIVDYLDKYNLGFKTFRIAELDEKLKEIAGDGARVSTEKMATAFEEVLLRRGLLCFPAIKDAADVDGHVRIFRAGTVAANILDAFRNPGPPGDKDLAALLKALRPDDARGGRAAGTNRGKSGPP